MFARLVPVGTVLPVLVLSSCGKSVRFGVARTPITLGGAGEPAAIGDASGRTLEVGPGHTLKLPSEAARAARDGDTVMIDPGEYDDCTVWRDNRVTIAARAPGVVFVGKTRQGKRQ